MPSKGALHSGPISARDCSHICTPHTPTTSTPGVRFDPHDQATTSRVTPSISHPLPGPAIMPTSHALSEPLPSAPTRLSSATSVVAAGIVSSRPVTAPPLPSSPSSRSSLPLPLQSSPRKVARSPSSHASRATAAPAPAPQLPGGPSRRGRKRASQRDSASLNSAPTLSSATSTATLPVRRERLRPPATSLSALARSATSLLCERSR